jgi:Zn-finger nucleic acid-binding protein
MFRMEAGMLTCPECGAPASPQAVQCSHCRVQLATTNCANCMGMNFLGAKCCSQCGEPLERPLASKSEQACPRCKKRLQTIAVGGSMLEECGACGGLWVDAASFQRLCENREEQSAYLGMGSPLVAPSVNEPEHNVRYVPCPECAKLMLRVNFARCSGVIVDVCKGHGTWFDKDELRRILEFIRKGGLDVAREKEKDHLELEKRRLKDQQMGVAEMPEPEHEYRGVIQAVRGIVDWLIS